MNSFPALKTGAVMQYPAGRTVTFSTQTLRFFDGSEQRFADYGAPLHQWNIQLDLLDEAEMKAMETFFREMTGQSGAFSFTDPWDGQVYPSCSFGGDELDESFLAELRGRTSLLVIENRS